MKFTVKWTQEALNNLKKINKPDAKRIFEKTNERLSTSPQLSGTPLKAHLKGFFRYRIGKYRVIYMIQEAEVTVIITKIGKREKIYEIKK